MHARSQDATHTSQTPPGLVWFTSPYDSPMSDCLFCQIIAGVVPSEQVSATGRTFAFRDIAPTAPTHVLVIPTVHHPDLASVAAADPTLLAELVTHAASVAQMEGLDGYRLVTNTGESAGQAVMHAHLHVLGGRPFRWPPG